MREEVTVNEIATREDISPVLISRWKAEFLENAATLFKKSGPTEAEKELEAERERVANLERKVGQLTYEVDWLKKNLSKSSATNDRKTYIDPGNMHIPTTFGQRFR